MLQHANVQLAFGGWNQLFATPDVHRLHHTRDARGVNYGIVIILLDRLFGTYAPPAAVAEDDIGLGEESAVAGVGYRAEPGASAAGARRPGSC